MATQVKMPQLGESITEGTVGKWLKQKGDRIELYEPLAEVITDKVNTEIPSPAAGTLLDLLVPEGETVRVGTPIALIGTPGETMPAPTAPSAASAAPARPVPAPRAAAAPAGGGTSRSRAAYLSPVVARLVAEHGIDVSQVQGTGEEGRVTKKDVEAYLARGGAGVVEAAKGAAEAPTTVPAVETAAPARAAEATATARAEAQRFDEVVPLTAMRRAIAENLLRSVQTAPHVTTVFEADMSRIVAHRAANKEAFARQDADLTYTAYFVEVVTRVLRDQPQVNASFTDEGMVYKRAINIGVAVALEDGLIVPVLKNADELNLLGIARGVNDLAQRARAKRLRPDDVQGGTFTITNPGIGGSLFGTPIIVQPQVAIMGIGSIVKRAVVVDDAIAIRPMVYLSLTFDHRALDGADGDRFLAAVKQRLESYA